MNDAAARFPRGLAQPRRGHRFAADALLLASFADPARGPVLDLGAGAGAVGLGLLLRGEKLSLTGLEQDEEAAGCLEENARRLGLASRVRVALGDVRAARSIIPPESFGQVVCNPPWLRPGRGRTSPDPAREAARVEELATLADFAAAAAHALPTRGLASFVVGADRLADLCAALAGARLTPKRLLLVHGRTGAPARFVLARAVKNARSGLIIEPPLFLHGPNPDEAGYLPGTLVFCPWLAAGKTQTRD